jgi:hypothetical protein
MSKAAGATMNAMIIAKIGPLVDPMHGLVLYHIGSLTGEALVNNRDGVLKNNQKAGPKPKGVSQLDGYKRTREQSNREPRAFWIETVTKVETLHEIIDGMGEDTGPADNSQPG